MRDLEQIQDTYTWTQTQKYIHTCTQPYTQASEPPVTVCACVCVVHWCLLAKPQGNAFKIVCIEHTVSQPRAVTHNP